MVAADLSFSGEAAALSNSERGGPEIALRRPGSISMAVVADVTAGTMAAVAPSVQRRAPSRRSAAGPGASHADFNTCQGMGQNDPGVGAAK